MKDITYSMEGVAGRLSAKIANLELELAHEREAKHAYMNRVNELEVELEKSKEKNEGAE